ncbi:type II toxin-antitoxin system PemK/MazF family toxin [Paenibacillus vandeheii]|uniref:type II toxin-antitoxin system PemK/MazF family toxin n=1 Tax=Paenibacillus amylolyticus TaxID=1451 RepID=UPI001059BEAA|nr:type II toxin-antitoxin system PemK/MazF family toxin [Paenibacillus amylolyticus]TDL70396.1 type II toxin-antitoxin system PemK/MazF family toxin [Paenibacillus amylolyticus]
MLTAHKTEYKRYELWFASLSNSSSGSVQRGKRPVLILQNNMGNRYSPTVQVATITKARKKDMPTHVNLNATECGLRDNSVVLFETMTTIEKDQLLWRIGEVPANYIPQLDRAGKIQLGYLSTWD